MLGVAFSAWARGKDVEAWNTLRIGAQIYVEICVWHRDRRLLQVRKSI